MNIKKLLLLFFISTSVIPSNNKAMIKDLLFEPLTDNPAAIIASCITGCAIGYFSSHLIIALTLKNKPDAFSKAAQQGSNPEKNLSWLIKFKGNNDIDAQDSNGFNALYYALIYQNINMMKFLINNGANTNLKYNNNTTPLHHAILMDNIDMMELLINANANVNAIDNESNSPLHYAVFNNNIDAMELLIQNGADIYFENNKDRSPRSYAACIYRDARALTLLNKYSDLNMIMNSLTSPLLLNKRTARSLKLTSSTLKKIDKDTTGAVFKFVQELPMIALENIFDYLMPIKDHIESKYIQQFLIKCYEHPKNNNSEYFFAHWFLNKFYLQHLLEMQDVISIRSQFGTPLPEINDFLTLLQKIMDTKEYNDLNEELKNKIEESYTGLSTPRKLLELD